MTAVHMMQQQGGWPLNCIALPDGRPIWGGTYFPKAQWINALDQIREYYRENPEKTLQYASELAEGIRENSIFRVETEVLDVSHEEVHRAVQSWTGQFDPRYGGSKGAPKFPMPVNLEFLLHYGFLYGDSDILDHVDLTLTSMARGGIYDQAGGGFARYSVDPVWKVPHFEKMLYDNAQLIRLYSKAYQLNGQDKYREVIRQSISYIHREMQAVEGAFFSALDADSEGEEGKYYVWGRQELEELLEGDFELFSEYYNINATGLWEEGRYILYRTSDAEAFARENGLDYSMMLDKINQWNVILLEARSQRIPPGLDDKSLTSWSSLMISGLVYAYKALGDPEYLKTAFRSAELIRDSLWTGEGILYRNYKNGQGSIPGFHIDYALFTEACLDLYSASLDRKWLDLAREVTEATLHLFYDQGSGMYTYSGKGSEILIANNVETQDNVIPSSNSVMAHNLFTLGHLLVDTSYLDKSSAMMKQMQERFLQYPHGFANWGSLLLKQLNPFYEIVVNGEDAQAVVASLSEDYLPHAVLTGSESESTLPLFRNRFELFKTRIFVCQGNVCQLPVEDPDDAKRIYHIK
jgi:uncharacterized protein YyaL (SSP411 family)